MVKIMLMGSVNMSCNTSNGFNIKGNLWLYLLYSIKPVGFILTCSSPNVWETFHPYMVECWRWLRNHKRQSSQTVKQSYSIPPPSSSICKALNIQTCLSAGQHRVFGKLPLKLGTKIIIIHNKIRRSPFYKM